MLNIAILLADVTKPEMSEHFDFDLTCDVTRDPDVNKIYFPSTVFPGLSNAACIFRIGPVVSEIRGGARNSPPSGARYKNTPVGRGLTWGSELARSGLRLDSKLSPIIWARLVSRLSSNDLGTRLVFVRFGTRSQAQLSCGNSARFGSVSETRGKYVINMFITLLHQINTFDRTPSTLKCEKIHEQCTANRINETVKRKLHNPCKNMY